MRHMYSYVFWVAENESEVKIESFMISYRHNLKTPYFLVCDEFKNRVRSVILFIYLKYNLKTKLPERHFSRLNWINVLTCIEVKLKLAL